MEGKKAATDPKTERYSIAEILLSSSCQNYNFQKTEKPG
jgi:hypothetical protein